MITQGSSWTRGDARPDSTLLAEFARDRKGTSGDMHFCKVVNDSRMNRPVFTKNCDLPMGHATNPWSADAGDFRAADCST